MTIKHIAFYIGENGLETWEVKKIHALSQLFRSSVSLFNISQCKRIPLENLLKTLAMGNKSKECCLLVIKGIDAELAHLVLVGYITEHFNVFNPAQTFNFAQQTNLDCQFQHLTPSKLSKLQVIDKATLLEAISPHIKAGNNKHIINTLLLEREEFSSTIMGQGVALPHIVTDQIKTPSIILCTLPKPTLWHKNHAPVDCVISIAMPIPTNIEVIHALTNLTKKLVSDFACQLLVNTSLELQPLVLANMLSELKTNH